MSENARRTVTRQPVSTGVRLPVMRRAQLREQPWDVIGVVALGGAIGAVARFGIGRAWPTPAGTFPWATLGINVSGCALIGVLMVLITELWTPHRLVRPFAGTGILGGFTTFSTYAVDIQRLLAVGAPRTGLAYLVVTPVTALAAVTVTVVLTRRAIRRVPPRRAIRRVPR